MLKDLDGNVVDPVSNALFQFLSYGSPTGNQTANAAGQVASVYDNADGTGTITAARTGQVIIEVRYAKQTLGKSASGGYGYGNFEANTFIYAQIAVRVEN